MKTQDMVWLGLALAVNLGSGSNAQCPTELAKLINPVDGFANEGWASSLATQGDLAVIGSHKSPSLSSASGAAYVFVRDSGTGSWSFNAKLTASDADTLDFFGFSVAISGDRIAVGAPADDEFATEAGAVYIFRRSMGAWVQEEKLLPNDLTSASLGAAVSLYDDTLAATELGRSLDDPGSVYFYRRDGTTWSLEQHSLFSSSQGHQSPDAISLYQSTCFVGARFSLLGSAGTVYVFNRSGTTWTETQALLAPGGLPGDEFGNSVAVEGTRAVVGAHRYEMVPPDIQVGTAYTFRVQQNGQWEFEQQLLPSDPVESGAFGRSIALHAGRILVGAPGAKTGDLRTGAAYQYNRQGGSWIEVAKYVASDAELNSDFGSSVSLATDGFVAAEFDDNTIGCQRGIGLYL